MKVESGAASAGPPPKQAGGASSSSCAVVGAAHKAKSRPPCRVGPADDRVEPAADHLHRIESNPPVRVEPAADLPIDSSGTSIKGIAESALRLRAGQHGLQEELHRAMEQHDATVGPIDEINMVALAFCSENRDNLNHAAGCSALLAAPKTTVSMVARAARHTHTHTHGHNHGHNSEIFLLETSHTKGYPVGWFSSTLERRLQDGVV